MLLTATLVAYALTPIVDALARRMPRSLAILAVYFLLLAAAGGVGWLVLPPLVAQAQTLVTAAPDLIAEVRDLLDR